MQTFCWKSIHPDSTYMLSIHSMNTSRINKLIVDDTSPMFFLSYSWCVFPGLMGDPGDFLLNRFMTFELPYATVVLIRFFFFCEASVDQSGLMCTRVCFFLLFFKISSFNFCLVGSVCLFSIVVLCTHFSTQKTYLRNYLYFVRLMPIDYKVE